MSRPSSLTHSFLLAGLLMLGFSAEAVAQATGGDRFVGFWLGTMQTPGGPLRMGLDIARGPGGALGAGFVSLDQGNARLPGDLTIHGDSLMVKIAAMSVSYAATLTAAGDSLRGTFSQGVPMPLNMARAERPAPPARPQEPKPPFPYSSEDVTFESVPGVRLAGTITRPQGGGPFPAVVMITGSGAQNRDEELLGHKPFFVIADYLARHGIATLRYDDRGFAKSTGNFAASTSADFANDAEAAVHFLQKQPGIASNKIGLIGHSEGGMIAPLVASRSKDVAFIVLLAGPGIPGDSILLLQQELIAKAQGAPQAAIDQGAEANRRLYAAVKESKDSADAVVRMQAAVDRMVAAVPAAQQAAARNALANAIRQLESPWMRYFLTYDPRPALRRVKVPVLALNGTLDLQVPYRQNLPAIEEALREGGNKNFKTIALPNLNHLFQTTKTGNPAEYETNTETFSPAVLELIGNWITDVTRGGK